LCWVLSHDAAGFVCGSADRPASPRLRRAGADPSDAACRHDLPGAVSQSGKSARRPYVSRAARTDPGESACRNGHFSAAVQSGDPIDAYSRACKSFHAPGGDPADSGDRVAAQRFPIHGCAHSRPGRGGAEAEESHGPSAAARDRA
jgi:hypothetical protein